MGYEKPESRADRNERRRAMKPALLEKMHNGEFPRTKLKVCRDCGELKECDWLGSFSMKGEPEYRARCPECYKKYCSEKRKRRRAHIMLHRNEVKEINKKKAIDMLGGKCECCGNTDPDVLTFHHTNPETKEFDIGSYLTSGRSFNNPKLQEELKKCKLLCFNCHVKFHLEETRKRQQERVDRNDNTKIERTRQPVYQYRRVYKRLDNTSGECNRPPSEGT